jgi:DNA polymerase III subunit chi
MTELAFHFNAPSKVDYACLLLRKATAARARVAVLTPAALMARLDQALWTFSPQDFVAHVSAPCSPQAMLHSQVLLCDDAAQAQGYTVLVNLTDALPTEFSRFDRVIEVVTADAADRSAARERWKQYVALGYAITRHDLKLNS